MPEYTFVYNASGWSPTQTFQMPDENPTPTTAQTANTANSQPQTSNYYTLTIAIIAGVAIAVIATFIITRARYKKITQTKQKSQISNFKLYLFNHFYYVYGGVYPSQVSVQGCPQSHCVVGVNGEHKKQAIPLQLHVCSPCYGCFGFRRQRIKEAD
jgi:hypothetical protein